MPHAMGHGASCAAKHVQSTGWGCTNTRDTVTIVVKHFQAVKTFVGPMGDVRTRSTESRRAASSPTSLSPSPALALTLKRGVTAGRNPIPGGGGPGMSRYQLKRGSRLGTCSPQLGELPSIECRGLQWTRRRSRALPAVQPSRAWRPGKRKKKGNGGARNLKRRPSPDAVLTGADLPTATT